VEYLRFGGIFRGNIPFYFPPRSKTPEEKTPIPPAIWRNVEEFFVTYI